MSPSYIQFIRKPAIVTFAGIAGISAPLGMLIPADRLAIPNWQSAGMQTRGGPSGAGIPVRNTIFTTLSPLGGGADDAPQINSAIGSCPPGQVVLLSAGTFIVSGTANSIINLNKAISLRGAGAGTTIIAKTNGAVEEMGFTGSIAATTLTVSAVDANTNLATSLFPIQIGDLGNTLGGQTITGQLTGAAGGVGTYSVSISQTVSSERMFAFQLTGPNRGPVVSVSPVGLNGLRPGDRDVTNTNSTNLTADVAAGAYSIQVSSAAAFHVGQIVLIDENSGAAWQPDPLTGNSTMCVFNGSISGTTLTVNSVNSGAIQVGQLIIGAGIPANVNVLSGGGTTWTLDTSLSISSEAMTASMQKWASADFRVEWAKSNPPESKDTFPTSPTNFFPTTPNTEGDFYSRLDRVICEVKEIQSIVGNIITFSSPMTISYRVSNSAQMTWYESASAPGTVINHLQGAGLENLSLMGGDAGNVQVNGAAYCWIQNCEGSAYNGHGIDFIGSFRIEMRHTYLHNAAVPEPGGGAYNIAFSNGSSEILIEDCISVRANKTIVSLASGAGCVVAYSYMDQQYIDYTGDATGGNWIETGLNASHVVGSHHVLFEGNWAPNGDNDSTHGASMYTGFYFRNQFSGYRQPFFNPHNGVTVDDSAANATSNQPYRCAGPQSYNRKNSYIGNVLGTQGKMSGWTYESFNGAVNRSIWISGWDTDFVPSPATDPNVVSTLIRDGNWDWLQGKQSWHTTPQTYPISSSIYLSGKPAFFGSNAWPWVDPSSGAVNTLPAKVRYDNANPNGP